MRKVISGLTLTFLVTLSGTATAMGNPASINCIKQGGKSQIVGSVGYCHLPNGVKCEEWALFRGECPAQKPIPPKPPVIGGTRDAHGCLGAAGYSWCASTKKCERPWELAKQKRFPNTPAAFNRFCRNSAR